MRPETQIDVSAPHGTTAKLPEMPASGPAGASVARAAALMAHLRGPEGCPWDREQTFDSIKRNTLEETYEVFDAIERRAWPELRDELGDMLLQVLFYAQMASEAGYFTLTDVADGLSAKLVQRHPHIFGDVTAKDAAAVQRTWDAVKQQERLAKRDTNAAETGLLEEVSRAMPAMTEAHKLGSRAGRVGFDWPSAEGLIDKLYEEIGELKAELAPDYKIGGRAALEDELGDLLFTSVNLARHLKLDPESALRGANAKFRRRFNAMEDAAGGRDALAQLSPDELERMWAKAKEATVKMDDRNV
jgi:ATP diphosphatase